MKKTSVLIILLVIAVIALSLTACNFGGSNNNADTNQQQTNTNQQNPQSEQHKHSFVNGTVTKAATYNSDGIKTYTCSCGEEKTETLAALIPTKQVVVDGKNIAVNNTKQNYDYNVRLVGNINAFGYSGSADANYTGKYRFDFSTGSLKFYRETSGVLLKDAKEYIFTNGNSRLKVKADKNGKIKKIGITRAEDDELNMINLPFVALIKALGVDNLTDVKRTSSGTYRFETTVVLSSGFAPLNKLFSVLDRFGDSLSIKDVTLTNPQGGIKILFNVSDDGVLLDYKYSFDISFPVSGQSVSLNVAYDQKASQSDITLPSISNIMQDKALIESVLTDFENSVNAVKNSDTYSIDMTAVNDFDAGWNKNAIVDKYISRMYKNVNDERVDFNHSFKYKAHTEEDGKESFAFTVANIQDGLVYEISRKGKNTQTLLESVTADDRFEIHTMLTGLTASDVDFIKVENNSDGSRTYTVFTCDSATYSIQQKIADLINSNTAEDAIPVENYFNENAYSIESAEFTFTVKNNALTSINVDIEMKYQPTGGEYSDEKITLKNSIELEFNKNLDKATEYSAPKNVETKIGSYGLNNVKYYIL